MEIIVTPQLTKLRQAKGYTQDKLSELSGISQSTISQFDNHVRHDDVVIFKLARVLEVNVEELFYVEVK